MQSLEWACRSPCNPALRAEQIHLSSQDAIANLLFAGISHNRLYELEKQLEELTGPDQNATYKPQRQDTQAESPR
jgi:hypothetical protein